MHMDSEALIRRGSSSTAALLYCEHFAYTGTVCCLLEIGLMMDTDVLYLAINKHLT